MEVRMLQETQPQHTYRIPLILIYQPELAFVEPTLA